MPASEGIKVVVGVSHANAFVRHMGAIIPLAKRADLRRHLQLAFLEALDDFQRQQRIEFIDYEPSAN